MHESPDRLLNTRFRQEGENLVVVREDADGKIMIFYFINDEIGKIAIKSFRKQHCFNYAQKLAATINQGDLKCLPLVHAFLGCRTNSAIYKGKVALLKAAQKSGNFALF